MAKGRRGTGEPYLRGKVYWIKYYVNGVAVRESTETSNKTKATEILNKKRGKAAEGKLTASKHTIAALLDMHVKALKRKKRADVSHVESRIENHLGPKLGNVSVRKFSLSHIEDYIDERMEEEAECSTINRELAALKTALGIGVKKNIMPRELKWEKLPELNVRAGFLDYDDYRRLLAELPDEVKPLLVFGYHYGIRKSELLGYRWEYVDWFAKELRVPQPDSKNREPKIIPFYGDVESWLLMENAKRDSQYAESPWIFSRAGKRIKDFRESWNDAVKRAKLQDSLGWFHDLRRSAARNMVNGGLDQAMAMKIGGWKTDSVFRRYRIVPRKDLHRAAEKMNEFFKAEEQALKKLGTKEGTMNASGVKGKVQ